MMNERNIGIIGDGATDRLIFRKVVECVLFKGNTSTSFNIIELEQHEIHDDVAHYWRVADRTNVYDLTSTHALELRDAVATTLTSAFSDFQTAVNGRVLSNKDILLLTTDSEKTLARPELYFVEPWAFSFPKILIGAVEKFYDTMIGWGYAHDGLPLVISMSTFPSTEILVGFAKNAHNQWHGKRPNQLKRLLYGTDDISSLEEEDLRKQALDFITPESIELIFKHVPESRLSIQTLLSLGAPN